MKTATAHKYGKILVDQKGLALYFNKPTTAVPLGLHGRLPRHLASSDPPPGRGHGPTEQRHKRSGTVSGANGRQVTWHGKPLYTFSHDSPGTVKGEGIAHVWYVVQLSRQAAGANWA